MSIAKTALYAGLFLTICANIYYTKTTSAQELGLVQDCPVALALACLLLLTLYISVARGYVSRPWRVFYTLFKPSNLGVITLTDGQKHSAEIYIFSYCPDMV